MKQSILVLALLALVACKKPAPAATDTNKPAPELPKDVQSVAAAATVTTSTTSSQSEVASETNGVIAATGEFASPVRS